MASANEKDAVQRVVLDYYHAVSRDPASAAAHYGKPAMVVLPSKILDLGSPAEVEEFFEKLLEELRPLGYAESKPEDPRIKMLSATTAIYSAVSVRQKADGSELQRAGFTYLLHKGDTGWKIHALITTDVDKLVRDD